MDRIDHRLLNDFQRDFPLAARPFDPIAATLGISEAEVIARLRAMATDGRIARIGATVRPNTVAASTLAALAVPADRIEAVAAIVGAEPGVNHAYLRESPDWNLWFVATAPDAAELACALARIEARSGLAVLSLPLRRAFNIDLGFCLDGARRTLPERAPADLGALRRGDRAILQALCDGLAIAPRPYALAGHDEAAVIARIAALADARIITRLGVIVKHRALGWRANAMVVWRLPDAAIAAAGPALAAVPGVTLCYQRQTRPGVWDWGLFAMIHAQSRDAAHAVLARACALPALAGARPRVLFSTRCFKQRGALVAGRAA